MGTLNSAIFMTVFSVGAIAFMPATARADPGAPVVVAMLQNDAAVPTDVAARAKVEVRRLFALIDVEIAWVSDVPRDGTTLRVVTLLRGEPMKKKMPPNALGYTASVGNVRGIRGYVVWSRVEQAAQDFAVGLDRVLAAAIAHELGHMLLPDGSHDTRGLMRASWNREHVRSASTGMLLFSSESGELMRRGLMQPNTALASRR
jgi:hypothetical protein